MDGQVPSDGAPGRPRQRQRLHRVFPDGRDAAPLRRRADARERHEAGRVVREVPRADDPAGHRGLDQPDRLLPDPGRAASALQGPDVGTVRRDHARRWAFRGHPHYHVYILTNVKRNVMYVGVTNKLENRVTEHGDGRGGAFTRRYQVKTPVYAEQYQYIDEAIAREKEIKGWRRSKKVLVEASNPTWVDLLDPGAAKGPSLRSG